MVALREYKKLAGQLEREKKNVEQAEKEAAAATGEAAEKAKAKLETARKKLAPLEEEYKKAAALAEGAKDLDNNPVGTGPYMFEEGNPGKFFEVKKEPQLVVRQVHRSGYALFRRDQNQRHPRPLGQSCQPQGRENRYLGARIFPDRHVQE